MTRLLAACLALCSTLALAEAPAAKRQPPPPSTPAAEARGGRPTLEVAFVLDTTSSMTGLIEGAKQKIWSIASRMATGKPTPRIRVALVGYRDRGDSYLTKRFDLTDDLDTVYGNLRAFRAEGGGDTPEHVGMAVGKTIKLL
ncbi:MAG: vWA domain-containing protein, partial [Myxococcaceae bacterium]